MSNGVSQYKKTAVQTANRGQVLIMLYEGALKHLKKAMDAIEKKQIAEKGIYIGKTHDIIIELTASLDHKIGGKIAEDLERLYNFMSEQLLKANMENSKARLESVYKTLETLLEGWRGAVAQAQKTGSLNK